MWYALLFGLVATGAQLLPAAIAIYFLLPTDRRCEACDGETLLVRPGPLGYVCSALAFGRLQRRWCPACGREALARAPLRIAHRLRARGRPRPADEDRPDLSPWPFPSDGPRERP